MCQGDQSAGIASGVDFNPAVISTLNVNNLNQDIVPGAGSDGIFFDSANSIFIASDTTNGPGGPFQITATGAGDNGIFANTTGNTVNINHSGDILADNTGITGRADLNVLVFVTGNVTTTTNAGIYANAANGAAVVVSNGIINSASTGIDASAEVGVDVESTGNINSTNSTGILAVAANGPADVTSVGNISAAANGISARALNGEATISSDGNITADGFGLNARAGQDITITSTGNVTSVLSGGIEAYTIGGAVEITTNGDIDAQNLGIYAYAGNGIRITSSGDISAEQSGGIRAYSATSTIRVLSDGNIDAAGSGISALGDSAVVVRSEGDLSSTGALGIFAQSVTDAVRITSTGNITAEFEGIRAEADQDVNVTSIGNIRSATDRGIAATSTAGEANISSTGDIAADAEGIRVLGEQNVTVSSAGNISSANSYGFFIQSANGDTAVTSTGDVNSTTTGILARTFNGNVSVVSSGNVTSLNTSGIYANAVNGRADIVVSGGTVVGGTRAIRAISANGSSITNSESGIVTGRVIVSGGGANNLFDNQHGAVFNSGTDVDLVDGLLRNAGTLAPGGEGVVQTTEVTGNVTQTGTGTFQVDVDAASVAADRVNVSQSANLDGTVQVNVLNPGLGAQEHVILSAAGGATDNGLVLGPTSPALKATLSFPNATDVVLNTQVDFAIDGLNQNQTNLAENLNGVVGAGGGTMGPVLNALLGNVFTFADYTNALDQLLPEVYLNTETVALFAAEEFNGNLLSCPRAGEGFTAISQGQCMWVRYDGRWLDRSGTFENIGYDEDSHGISGGGQVAVAPYWFIGVAGAYEDGSLDTRTNASADSERYMLGGVIKYQSGPVLMALAGSIGTGGVDIARPINFGGFNATARSSFDVDHVGATFHAAYLMDRSAWYAKPFIDVNVTHIERDAARETGGGAANLNVAGSDETYVSVTPALELGTTIERGDGRAIRPYVRAGVTVYSDTDQSLSARFAGAPAAAGSFTTRSEFDDIFADIEAGVTLLHGDHGTVSAGYEGRFSDDTEVHGIFVKGTRNF